LHLTVPIKSLQLVVKVTQILVTARCVQHHVQILMADFRDDSVVYNASIIIGHDSVGTTPIFQALNITHYNAFQEADSIFALYT
jgi:hypothetical protein